MSSRMGSLFLIVCGIVMLTGLALAIIGIRHGWLFGCIGVALGYGGGILLVTGFASDSIVETREVKGLTILMVAGCLLAILGLASWTAFGGGVVAIGAALVFFSFIMWPCFCCQGLKDIRSQIVGVVSAHDNISIDEISKITGYSKPTVRNIVYDAIGKSELHGRVEDDIFIRSAPSAPAHGVPSITTKDGETVKALIICPHCGAKTEQGISKCQKCQADL